jgi:glycosyltransferase involved in cell wall biosynthesis
MDLVGDMLAREFAARPGDGLAVAQLRPRFVPRLSRVSTGAGKRHLFNADRIMNRFLDYPRFLRARRSESDLFHIVDHSYSHLVRVAGPERTVVTCHDLDAFRPVIERNGEGKSWLMGKMARTILDGFGKAAAVACVSVATRDEVIRHQLVPSERLTVNRNGVADTFNPRPHFWPDREVCRLLGSADSGRLEILHVGSTIPRKRIDLLLRVFDALRGEARHARLIRVGGAFTVAQRRLMNQLALPFDSVVVLPFVSSEVLAAVYRRAALVVLPSEFEGFGLPVLEALSCGTPVVLSDIPVFREIGGPPATFCPVGAVEPWTEAILSLSRERRDRPRCWDERVDAGVKWAGRFTWKEYAERAASLYRTIIL